MKIFQRMIVLVVLGLPLNCWGQIYQAGQMPSNASNQEALWDISLGVYHSNMKLTDPAQETLFSNEQGISLRGLYALSPSFFAGAEGGISQRKSFPIQNKYHHLYYGAVTKWVLTPQTQPCVYVLLGAGVNQWKLSYAGSWTHTATKPYVTGGTGIEWGIGQLGYVGLEAQARYNTHRTLQALTRINHRLEILVGLRGGVRF